MIHISERSVELSPDACIPYLIAAQAERTPDAMAIAAPGRRALTYGRLWTHIECVVAQLNAMGIGRNDRVAIVLPNGPEMAVAFLAVAAGATAAPLNPAYRTTEFDFYLSDLNAKALIVQPGMDSLARAVAQARGLPILELAPVLESAAGLFTLKGEEPLHPARDGFAQPDDVAIVLHTSGTTSRPKMVPLTQRNLCVSAYHIAATLTLTEADRCLNVMPLFHIHGLVGAFLSSLMAGGSVVCTSGFDPEKFFAWLGEFCPTWYTAVHTMHQAVLSRAQTDGKILRSSPLRFIRSSSTALPPRVMQQLEEAFHVPVIEAYGMTEAAHQIASNPLPPSQRKQGSVGVAAGPEVAIMDDEGNLLPPAQTGEIVIRGASVTPGYENSLAADQSAFTNGWFRTGDQGYLDGDGYLFITGRLKEIINRAGEKISPYEIDKTLMDHPDICQAAAFAVPHPSLGEDVAAAVVLRQDRRLTESMIREYLLGRLADFKVPAKVWIVDDIPKGPSGKIQRTGLAEKFAEQLRRDFIPPRNKLEAMVAAIYAEVLDLERVGADGNFFVLGGDSLRAMQIISRIRTVFQVNTSIATLFRKVTVAELAEEITASAESVDPSVMAEILTEVTSLSDEATEKLLADELDQDPSQDNSQWEQPMTKDRPSASNTTDRMSHKIEGLLPQAAALAGNNIGKAIDGHTLAAESLKKLGVTHVYGISGTPVRETLAYCAKVGIRSIGVHHQQAGVMMATAQNYVTGRLSAVALISAGPAVTNAATGILVARDNCWPVVVLGGRRPLSMRGMGSFQELDAVSLYRSITKWSAVVESACSIPDALERAFRIALTGRPGPVYLDLPEDILTEIVRSYELPSLSIPKALPSDNDAVARAAEILHCADRPAIIVGKGIRWSDAYEELTRLVDDFGIPFITSPMGRGYLSDDHPLCCNAVPSLLQSTADAILLVGARLDWTFRFGSEFAPGAKIIQIDIDDQEIGVNVASTVGIVGDAKEALSKLIAGLIAKSNGNNGDRFVSWYAILTEAIEKKRRNLKSLMNSDRLPMSPYRMLKEIGDFLPRDAICVLDGNVFMAVAQQVLPSFVPAARFTAGTNGCMGVGIPFGIGAKLSRPERPVIVITGDTAFAFNAMEMETAVRHRVPIIIIVVNNEGNCGALIQKSLYPPDSERVTMFQPDIRYDAIMRTFGGHAEFVERPEELIPALQRSLESGVPACINVKVDPNEPYPHEEVMHEE